MRTRHLIPAALLLLGLAGVATSQDEPLDEARLRRAIDRDPARAVDELNERVRGARDPATRALLRLLRAVALARLGEKKDALEDLHAVLDEPREGRVETEATALTLHLRGVALALAAVTPWCAPGEAAVVLSGSATGTLAIDWAVYQVAAEKLRAALRHDPSLDALLQRPPPETLSRLDAWHETIEARGPFTARPPLPQIQGPGIYLVTASLDGAPLRATIVVRRHATLLRLAAQGGLLWTLDTRTGEPCDATLDLLDAGFHPLGETTGALAVASVPTSGALLAWSEGSLATLTLDHRPEAPRAEPTPLELRVLEPLVAPGGVVRAWATSPVVGSTHTVLLRDPLGRALAGTTVTLDANGVGSLALPVPEIEGVATLDAPGGSARFLVAARRERVFAVDLADAPGLLLPGNALVAHVHARTGGLAGAPLAGAPTSWDLRDRSTGAAILSGEGALDEDGALKVAARWEALAGTAPLRRERELVLSASVRDPAGREERVAAPVRLLPGPFEIVPLGLVPGAVHAPSRVPVSVLVRALDGKKATGVAVVASAHLAGSARPFFTWERTLGADARADLTFTIDAPGRVVFGIAVVASSGTATFEREIVATPRAPGDLAIDLDRSVHRPDEKVTVFARFPRERGTALVTKERDRIVWHELRPFTGGALELEVPLAPEDAPGVTLRVAALSAGLVLEASARLSVSASPAIALEAEPASPVLASGEPLALATDTHLRERDEPVAAALRVSVADARPFDLLRELLSGRDLPPALLETARALVVAPGIELAASGDGKTLVETPLPGASGRMRVSVLAARRGRTARVEPEVVVEQPLAIAIALPSRLVEGDEGQLEATVASTLDGEAEVKVTFTPRGLLLRGEPRIEGASLAKGRPAEAGVAWITMPPRGSARLVFVAKAPAPGLAGLDMEALAEKAQARASADALVQGRSVPRSMTLAGSLTTQIALEAPALDAAHPDALRGELVFAPSIGAAGRDALAALALRSGSAREIAASFAPGLEAAPACSASGVTLDLAPARGVLSLLALQEPDGAWPGSGTAAALEALAIARVATGALTWRPSEGAPGLLLIDAAIERGAAAAERELASLELAERPELALALAVAGRPPRAALDDLLGRRLDPAGRATLGRALLAAGDRERARAVARELAALPEADLVTRASTLLLLALLDDLPARRVELASELLGKRHGAGWETVAATAVAGRALLEHAARKPGTPARELLVTSAGRELARRRPVPGELASLRIVLDGKALARARALELRETGGTETPYALELSWTKLTQGLRPLDRGIALKREVSRFVVREDGSAGSDPCDPARGVPLGAELRVTVTVASLAGEPIVVAEPIPAGLRFLGVVGPGEARTSADGLVLVPGGGLVRTLTYALRAERRGEWRGLPGRASVEGRPELEGESDEWLVRIRE